MPPAARGVPALSSCLGSAALWLPREQPKRGRMVPQGCQGSHAQPPSSSAPTDAAYLQPAHAGSTGAQSCARMTLGLRRVLPIWAARLLCRTVRAPPPDWRGRGSRALSPHALVHTRRSVPIGCHRQVLVRSPARRALRSQALIAAHRCWSPRVRIRCGFGPCCGARRKRTCTSTGACPMPGCRSPPAPIAAQVAGVRAAGDGGALPCAVARRAGGVRRHLLVPRAHQAQRLAVGVDAILHTRAGHVHA